MLQIIPWKLPGYAQQPDINDIIHSVTILEHIEHFEQQGINKRPCYRPTPIRIWIQEPHQFDRGRTIQ
jgi:hypothetical protein